MKWIKFKIFVVMFFALISNSFSQKAKIETKEKVIITNISAVSNDEIFSDYGSIKITDIIGVIFETYDSKFLSLYGKLEKKVPVKFGDGSNIGEIGINTESLNITQKESFSNLPNDKKDNPEDYLIKASKNALLGFGLSVLGIVVATVSLGGEENVGIVAGGALSIFGIGLTIDAWSNIGKAGKAMKKEREQKSKVK